MPLLKNRLSFLSGVATRRRLMISAWLLVGVLLFSSLGLPVLARWGIEKYGSEALGRTLGVGSVSFNPFLLKLQVEDLRIAEAGDSGEFFSLATLQLDLSSASLWHRAWVLDGLRIERPRLNLVRTDDQRFNFSDIAERFSASPEASSSSEAPRFALGNIELSAGEVVFEDRLIKETHKISQLELGLPFVSNLPTRLESVVEPRLSFELNDSAVLLFAEVKPFSDHRIATLNLDLEDFDLTRYLAYLPRKLPFRIEQARLNSALRLHWEEALGHQPGVFALSGRLGLSDLKLKDAGGAELLAFKRMQVDLDRVEPLASPALIHIAQVQVEAPTLELLREKDQRFRVQRLIEALNAPAAGAKPQAASGPAPNFILDKLGITQARVHWRDEVPAAGFELMLAPIDLELTGFNPAAKEAARLAVKIGAPNKLNAQVQATLGIATQTYGGQFSIGGLLLEHFRPYYAEALPRALFKGEAALSANFAVAPGQAGAAVKLEKMALELKEFSLSDTRAGEAKSAVLVRIPQSRAEGVRVDMETRALHVERFTNRGMKMSLQRDAAGRFNLPELFQSASSTALKAKAELKSSLEQAAERVLEAAPAEEQGLPWQMSIGSLDLGEGGLRFEDQIGHAPVVAELREISLSLKDWSLRSEAQAQAVLSAKINRSGRIKLDSRFSSSPVRGTANIDLKTLDLLPLQPYLEDKFRLLLTRGSFTTLGRLDFDLSHSGPPDMRFAGEMSVNDLNVLDRVNDEDFLRWSRFSVNDIKAQLAPLAFSSKEIRLKDFYTRLILDAQGRLNLREFAAQETASSSPPVAQSAPPEASGRTAEPQAKKQAALAFGVERIVLENGQVRFSDRFVTPNYDANLLSLSGTLGGLSSDQESVATLELSASLDGAAPVKVYGGLNPFRQDGYLDIQAQVRDVDLTTASTYSARYVGYGIERGKFSMDVQYQIRNRQLSATNSLRLDQLSFGDRVESPEATSLPVLLAVALLKDRRGMIDIRLPISGSLDDPSFSLGGVILKVLRNLISKAVTAPFALLGSMFGDEAEALAYLDFSPGSAEMLAPGLEKLAELARIMADRPALKLDLSGRYEPASDTTGLKRERLMARLRSLKAGEMARRGESVAEVDHLKIADAEYPLLLTQLYESEPIDARPRNALGLLRSLPRAEMEKILLASYVVSTPDLEALATRRAQHVQAYLIEQGKVDASRIFMLGGTSSIETAPMPRVEFSVRH